MSPQFKQFLIMTGAVVVGVLVYDQVINRLMASAAAKAEAPAAA